MSDTLITGFAHVGLRVADHARSRAFYELLGFEHVAGPVGPEPVAIMTHPSGVELNLVLNGNDPEPHNVLMDVDAKHAGYTHIALWVRSLDEAMARLAAAEIPLSGGPVEFPTGARAIFVRDPDRNVVELDERISES